MSIRARLLNCLMPASLAAGILVSPLMAQTVIDAVEDEVTFSKTISVEVPLLEQPSEREHLQFRRRLELHLETWCDWAAAVAILTPEARRGMGQRIPVVVEEIAGWHESETRPVPAPIQLDSDFPYLFTAHFSHPADAFSLVLGGRTNAQRLEEVLHPEAIKARLTRKLLTTDARALLSREHLARVSARRHAFRELLLARVDAVALLSAPQRQLLLLESLKSAGERSDTPFSLAGVHPEQTYGLSAFWLYQPSFQKSLGTGQKLALGLPGSQLHAGYLEVPNVQTRDDWNQSLGLMCQSARDQALQEIGADINHLIQLREVSPADQEKLRLASKGVAMKFVDSMREAANDAFEQKDANQRVLVMDRSRIIPISNSTSADLLQDPLWQTVLEGVLNNSPLRPPAPERAAAWRSAHATAVLGLLDQELWLTRDQQASLLPLVESSLPRELNLMGAEENLSLLALPGFVLTRISPAERGHRLSPAQREAWNELASYYEFREGPTGPQLVVRGRAAPLVINLPAD